MRKKLFSSFVFGIILTLSMIGSLSVSASMTDQDIPKSPKFGWEEDSGTATITIDDFCVKVVGRGQMVHFQFWNESDPEVKYNVNFVNLVEFEDLNQDGVFQPDEMKAGPQTTSEAPKTTGGAQTAPGGPQTILPLAKVEWIFGGFESDVNGEGETTAIHFSFISAEISDSTYSDVWLELRFHLYIDPQEIDLDGTTYPLLGSTELKFDIIVENWPWATPDNLLALMFKIRSESVNPQRNCMLVTEESQARNKLNVNEMINQTQRFRGTAESKQQFHFEEENQVNAYFAFANKVKLQNKDTETFESVRCSYMTDGANVQVYLTFPHFEDRMEYDPSVGIGDPQSSSPLEPKSPLQTMWDAASRKVTTSIGDFSVQVVGQGESLHIQFWNVSDPEVKYTVNFMSLIEFEDLNQDGVFQSNETKGKPQINLPLAKVDWTFEGFQNDTNEEGDITAIHFAFTSSEINDPAFSDVDLQILCHLYLDDQEIDLGGTTYPILGSTEFKFDIVIDNWPWTTPYNLLALRFKIRPEFDDSQRNCAPVAEEFQARNKLNVQEAMNQTQGFKGDVEPKQQFSFEMDSKVAAYFAFANQVKVMNAQNESFEPVACSYMTDGTDLQVYLTFPHFEERMEYDPSVGIVSSSVTPVTTSDTPDTTSDTPDTTSDTVFELRAPIVFFGVIILLIGIMIPLKKRN